jgi:hypothetical protein
MYTQAAFRNTRNAPPRDQVLTQKDFKRKKQERFPMKALLRSSIFALFVFAGYAAIATDISKPHSNANLPFPCGTNPPRAFCQAGK